MRLPNKFFWFALLAGIGLFGVMAYLWTRVESQQRQTAGQGRLL